MIGSTGVSASSAAVTLTSGLTKDLGMLVLNSTSTTGIVTGTVFISTGGALRGITVSCGGASAATNSSGFYALNVQPGTGLAVIANPANANAGYTTSAYPSPLSVSAGQEVGGVNFTLMAAGKIKGRVISGGTSGLPNVLLSAQAPVGTERAVIGSDSGGYFTLSNLPISSLSGIGAYQVSPVLDPAEHATPDYYAATVTQGSTVNVGTFTVTGSLGTIKGWVSLNGSSVTPTGTMITTGVLILATQSTLGSDVNGSSAVDWDADLRSGGVLYYSAHSDYSGSFTLQVRVSTTPYNVYAWYSAPSGSSMATSRKSGTATVLNNTSLYTVGFTWP